LNAFRESGRSLLTSLDCHLKVKTASGQQTTAATTGDGGIESFAVEEGAVAIGQDDESLIALTPLGLVNRRGPGAFEIGLDRTEFVTLALTLRTDALEMDEETRAFGGDHPQVTIGETSTRIVASHENRFAGKPGLSG
jgi:hypothetical protein